MRLLVLIAFISGPVFAARNSEGALETPQVKNPRLLKRVNDQLGRILKNRDMELLQLFAALNSPNAVACFSEAADGQAVCFNKDAQKVQSDAVMSPGVTSSIINPAE